MAASVPEQILSAATRLFAERGFDGTSLQEISDAVGIRKPSLLYHFSSKDELRRRVMEGLLAHWNELLPSLLVAATSGEGQFDSVLRETISFFAADPDRARLLMREVLDRPDEMGELVDTHVRRWVAIIGNYIRKGIEQGNVHPDVDAEAYIFSTINLVVANVATFNALGSVLSSKRGADAFDQYVKETLRIAKTSLLKAGPHG